MTDERSPEPCDKRGTVAWAVGLDDGGVAHLSLCAAHHELVVGLVGDHAFPPGSLN